MAFRRGVEAVIDEKTGENRVMFCLELEDTIIIISTWANVSPSSLRRVARYIQKSEGEKEGNRKDIEKYAKLD